MALCVGGRCLGTWLSLEGPRTGVVVLIEKIDSGGGSEPTLVEFAVAVSEGGVPTHIVVSSSKWVQRFLLRWRLSRASRRGARLTVSSMGRLVDSRAARSVALKYLRGPSRLRFTAFRFLLGFDRTRTRRFLRSASVILTSQTISTRGIEEVTRLSGARFVLNHNGSPEDFLWKWVRRPGPLTAADFTEYERYLNAFSSIAFQSDAHMEEFVALHPDNASVKGVVWPSCNEQKILAGVRSRSPFNEGSFNLLCVAKFQSAKGQLELVHAFGSLAQEFPDVNMTFLGGESSERGYRDHCIRVAQSLGLSGRVFFEGYRRDVAAYLAHCDAMVLPSSCEGVSRAVREASFLGRPIVCSRLSGLEGFLGPSGALYFEDRTAAGLHNTLRHALLNPQALRLAGEVARSAYLEKASFDKFAASARGFLLTQISR